MDFYAVLDHVLELLRHRRKVTYKALQLQFSLDDGCLAALKEELLYAYPQVVDDEGRGLVWTGAALPPETDVWRGVALGFSDIVTLVTARLQQEKRLTYAALKHIFGLDEVTLEDRWAVSADGTRVLYHVVRPIAASVGLPHV